MDVYVKEDFSIELREPRRDESFLIFEGERGPARLATIEDGLLEAVDRGNYDKEALKAICEYLYKTRVESARLCVGAGGILANNGNLFLEATESYEKLYFKAGEIDTAVKEFLESEDLIPRGHSVSSIPSCMREGDTDAEIIDNYLFQMNMY